MSAFNETSVKQRMSIWKRKETIFNVHVCSCLLWLPFDFEGSSIFHPTTNFLFSDLLNLDQKEDLSLKNRTKQHTIQIL